MRLEGRDRRGGRLGTRTGGGALENPAASASPESYAILSALVPGLGQAAQRRWVPAAIQLATVASYLAGAIAVGNRHALWWALAWNVWSIIDAYRHGKK